jgi:hypothetical protein
MVIPRAGFVRIILLEEYLRHKDEKAWRRGG